jgi:hypothetical protein
MRAALQPYIPVQPGVRQMLREHAEHVAGGRQYGRGHLATVTSHTGLMAYRPAMNRHYPGSTPGSSTQQDRRQPMDTKEFTYTDVDGVPLHIELHRGGYATISVRENPRQTDIALVKFDELMNGLGFYRTGDGGFMPQGGDVVVVE